MNSLKKKIGEDIKSKISKNFHLLSVSDLAEEYLISYRNKLTHELEKILESLATMSAGSEFEYTEKELRILAEKLINEGSKEELEFPDPAISLKAEALDEAWLMC